MVTNLRADAVPSPCPRTLAAGVVAYNEEPNLRFAVRSLIEQELPDGVTWGNIWIVASGCTDGTVEVADTLAAEDSRVRVIVEPRRGGKAHALRHVFRHAKGDALVLLNSDARAEPGAVGQLVRTAQGKSAPYAVMARPVVPRSALGRWTPTLRWMWDLHHEFHAELLAHGIGGHLSDELLLVSAPGVPPVPDGIINDGSYLAVWLSQHGGGRWYAHDARVSIQVPSTVRDHLNQRRRIHVGNLQVTSALGAPPATLPRQFLQSPADTVRLLGRMIARDDGFEHFGKLVAWELASYGLAAWDCLPPKKDHVRWKRIRTFSPRPATNSAPTQWAEPVRRGVTERRVSSLLRVASEFGTGVPVEQLHQLLPTGRPSTAEALGRWLEERPDLARLNGGRAFTPTATISPTGDRVARARQYREFAEVLWNGPLSFGKDLVRCIAVSGSVAFGEPRPGDDLDLFVVVRSGSLWWFLARAYFALLVARWRSAGTWGPTPCLNYVLEDREAAVEFARRSDLIFAREALSVQVLRGDEYYRGLLAAGPWMQEEIPRLYAARTRAPGSIASRPAPRSIRLLNIGVFPFLAAYLHLRGIARNARSRRRSPSDHGFRTVTGLRRLVFASHKFEQLRGHYARCEPAGLGPEAKDGAAGALEAR